MKYILDTHILLWWLGDHKSLSQKHRLIIANPKNIVFVSAVSIWEIEIKRGLGKISAPFIDSSIIAESQFLELPITANHALYLKNLPNYHNDPFDRLLICQSKVEKAILLTEDEDIKKYEIIDDNGLLK